MKKVPCDAVSENNQLHVAHLLHVDVLQQVKDECGLEPPEVPSKCTTRRDSQT